MFWVVQLPGGLPLDGCLGASAAAQRGASAEGGGDTTMTRMQQLAAVVGRLVAKPYVRTLGPASHAIGARPLDAIYTILKYNYISTIPAHI